MLFPSAGSTLEVELSQNFAESETIDLPAVGIPENWTGRVFADLYINTVDTSPTASNGTLGHWLRQLKMNVRRQADGPIAITEASQYITGADDISSGNYGIAASFVVASDGSGVQVRVAGIPNKKLFLDGVIKLERGRIVGSDG